MGKVDVFGLFRVGICSPARCFLAGVITNCIGLYHHFGAFAKLVKKSLLCKTLYCVVYA